MKPHATPQESGGHSEPAGARVSLSTLTLKTVVVHTVTYFCAGVLAYTLGDYERTFAEPPLSYFMRPTTDPWIMAGPMLQPVRGVIFALAFFPLRHVLFASRGGWLILWWLLVALGVLSTFGPAPGSVEGLIYTIIPPVAQVLGLWEVLLQSFLLSALLVYWVNRPGRRWLTWTLGAAFLLVFTFALLGLLVAPANARGRSPRSADATVQPAIVRIPATLGAFAPRRAPSCPAQSIDVRF